MTVASRRLRVASLAACLGGAVVPLTAFAQQQPAAAPATQPASSEDAKVEYKANDMLNKGLELLELKQEERGLKLISSIPQMFPKSKARFKAYLALGKHYTDTKRYELAIKQYEYLNDSEDPDQQAEGLYQTGICYYGLNSFDKAFMAFRRVTNEFPWSVYANEAYYYIGQCHFKLGRWAKAVEALEMVGTSVEPDKKEAVPAESGQRLYVKIYDKDLLVLRTTGQKVDVTLTAAGGDREQITIEPLGRTGEYYIGSLPTAPGDAKPGDGTLQTLGPDTVTVEYLDQNTEAGKLNEKKLSKIQMVSTAVVGFTDGAYREYAKGVFGDADCFLRVKDIDHDTTPNKDQLQVKVRSQYKLEREQSLEQTGVDLTEEEEIVTRDSVLVTLTETGPHTGIFVGTLVPKVVTDAAQVKPSDPTLSVMKGDDVIVEYTDEAHVGGREPRLVASGAKLLIGQIQDVKVEHRVVDSLDLKAKKNLIEAKIYLRLGQIFKEVGLTTKASEKADEGLDRVEDVISTSLRASLDRAIVEDAFSVKWDLLLVQDKLAEAIQVCRALTELFPDSSLVDKALLKIGMAKAESDTPAEAIGIFAAVTQLPKSSLKAEAQFHIGETLEKIATKEAEVYGRPPALSGAMQAYKTCAETYPNSPFAGDALDRIANYYINTKDYARAVELMERVTQDYPDASFLDKMLLKWVIAAYRMNNFQLAKDKAEQLLSEYPNSKSAEKARTFLDVINKKIDGGGGGETAGAASAG